jgi:hypothetical protein
VILLDDFEPFGIEVERKDGSIKTKGHVIIGKMLLCRRSCVIIHAPGGSLSCTK